MFKPNTEGMYEWESYQGNDWVNEWLGELVSEWGPDWMNEWTHQWSNLSNEKNSAINLTLTSGTLVATQKRVSMVRSEVCVCVYVRVRIPRPHQQTAK